MTETNDKQEQRDRWVSLLNAGWMFHQQMVKETAPEILGDAGSDDHMFHKALSVAIMDAMNFIRQVESMGWFDDDGKMEEDTLSQPGPAG